MTMYKRFLQLGWIEALRKSRGVRITLEGREALLKRLNIVVGRKPAQWKAGWHKHLATLKGNSRGCVLKIRITPRMHSDAS